MSRVVARRPLRAAWLAAALALAGVAGAAAQTAVSSPAGFEMTRSVQQSLKRLQELWLQWLGASLQDNPARAAETLSSLRGTARQIGFERLPDLALGAAARARQSAEEGDPARARRELEAAEALDPGRPEVAFTAAAVARRQGSWVNTAAWTARGFARLLSPTYRGPLLERLGLWALLALLVAAAMLVVVEAAMKGSAVYGDLERWLSARMPTPAAHAISLLVLLGPGALPGGPVWLLLVWTVFLWGYGSSSERAVLGLVWLALGLAPLGAAGLERRLALEQSPPVRALDDLEAGRLAGTLFADLQVLRTALPNDADVLELVADVHRTLGQWEIARVLYRQEVAQKGEVTTALLNLGADAFRTGDFGAASGFFQRAAATTPPSAAAWYNLSLSYSESYQFEESRRALARAREIDGSRVDAWIQTPNPDRVLTFNGGLAHRAQIVDRLRATWTTHGGERESGPAPGFLLRYQPPLAVVLAALLAIVLHLVRRGHGYGEPASWLAWRTSEPARWLRAVVPALSHAEMGEGFAAGFNVLVLVVLGSLPTLANLGGDFPNCDAVRVATLVLAALGALVYVVVRVRGELVTTGS
jgi:tetratricopeptide (TPR) repeat protein